MNAHEEREELATKIDAVADRMDALESSVTGLVAAWEGAIWLVAAIKWFATVGVALSGLWYVVKHFGHNPPPT